MRIVSARVTNYRSVIDSTTFDVEKDKTILVGINEAGKTAILRALQQINAPSDIPKLDHLADYPRRLLNDLQTGKTVAQKVQVAEVTYSLAPADRAALPKGLAVDEGATITLHRYLDNHRTYSLHGAQEVPTLGEIKADATRLRAHVSKQGDSTDAVTALDQVLAQADDEPITGAAAKVLCHALDRALPLVDEENAKEVERHARLDKASKVEALRQQAADTLIQRVPLMVYYSTYFTVRPRIDLESLASRQARGNIDDEYDFGNLCLLRFLGFSAQELSELAAGAPVKSPYYETDPAVRKAHDDAVAAHQRKLDDRQYRLNSASVTLTQDIRRVWGDDGMKLRLLADGQYLKVMVEDDLGVEVELDQRSEGFRWLVSFFVVFRAQAQDELEGAILLLDEPGLSLHALKQQEFRKTVSLLGEDNQIIYTTHSPFMVGSDELDLVRIVEMIDRKAGTKVHTRVQVDDPKSIFPLQAALGYELAQSMFSQKRNLVCEGVTDMFYLNAVNEAAAPDGGPTFKNGPAVVPAGTASKVAYFCTIYASQGLSVAALLDSDAAGDLAATQDALVAMLPKKAILRVADFLESPVRAAEMEDLFRTTLAEVAKGLGWDSTATVSSQPSRALMAILESEHGKNSVSKWKLVKAFSKWLQENGYGGLTDTERGGWSKLVVAVNKAL